MAGCNGEWDDHRFTRPRYRSRKTVRLQGQILSHRGAHGRGSHGATDQEIREALNSPVFGGTSHLEQLKEVGTDMQLISPRPYQMMHSEDPKVVQLVHRRDQQHHRQAGEALSATCSAAFAGCRRRPGVSPKEVLPYLEKCVKEQGFVGCLLNPDPERSDGHDDSSARRPLLVSAVRKAGRARYSRPHPLGRLPLASASPTRCTSSTKRASRVVSLLESNVFKDFPTLKILVSHGGGAIPYQLGALRSQLAAPRRRAFLREDAQPVLRHGALFEGVARAAVQDRRRDRCLFGTERPGVGTVKDPRTGRWLDETRFTDRSVSTG